MPKLTPPVGYMGGKRRLLPRLRDLFDPNEIEVYAEPYLGMGAMYLDLRAHGFTGPALAAEKSPVLRNLWRFLHDPTQGPLLLDALEKWSSSMDPDFFYQVARSPRPEDPIEEAAEWAWLLNYGYAGRPPVRQADHWQVNGCKLTSAAKWGKKFPWEPCVTRFKAVHRVLSGLPFHIYEDAAEIYQDADRVVTSVYADPVYEGTKKYMTGEFHVGEDVIEHIQGFRLFVISEKRVIPGSEKAGMSLLRGEITERTSQGKGATGSRSEILHVYRNQEKATQTTLLDLLMGGSPFSSKG